MYRNAFTRLNYARLAVVLTGLTVPFLAPLKLEARCGNHVYLYEALSTTTAPCDGSCPKRVSPRAIFVPAQRGLLEEFILDLTMFRDRVAKVFASPTQGRPHYPCEGPTCSKQVPPATAPVSSPTRQNNDPIATVSDAETGNQTSRPVADQTALRHVLACLDSIFHPPRFI